MNDLAYAWRSLWRNRRRTFITLAAIALSIMLVQAFHNLSIGTYAQMIDSGVRAGSGHLAVYRDGYLAGREEQYSFAPGELLPRIAALDGVAAVLPRLYLPALAQSSRDSRGILLIGVDPQAERRVNPFLKGLEQDNLLRDIRIYLLSVLRVANAGLLPYDFVATADEFAGAVERYAKAAGDHADLTPAKQATAAFRAAVARLQADAAAGRVPASRANELMKRLARILVPINFTRAPRFAHDPAFTAPQLPGLAVAQELSRYSGPMLGFAKTQLMRSQNRYVAALRDATHLLG